MPPTDDLRPPWELELPLPALESIFRGWHCERAVEGQTFVAEGWRRDDGRREVYTGIAPTLALRGLVQHAGGRP